MQLKSLTHGTRFEIKQTGETGMLLGRFGSSFVVVMDSNPRLTNREPNTEVESV